MNTSFPRSLETANGKLLYSGTAAEAGAHLYLNPFIGQIATVFKGIVCQSGPAYSWLEIQGSPALPNVKISHQRISGGASGLSIKDFLFVGCLEYGETVEAKLGWRIRPAPRPAKCQRIFGEILSVSRNGVVIRDSSYRTYHADPLQIRAIRAPGKRMAVTFLPITTGIRSTAMDVRAF